MMKQVSVEQMRKHMNNEICLFAWSQVSQSFTRWGLGLQGEIHRSKLTWKMIYLYLIESSRWAEVDDQSGISLV